VTVASGPWRRRTGTFSSLAVPNYRLYFFGQLGSVTGTWMQTVAQSFLVLGLTHSGTALGLTTAARFAPLLVLGPWGGLVVDRLDKRRLMTVTQVCSAAVALVFGVLVSTGAIRIWAVYLLAAALGLVNVFDTPARQALIPELVPLDHLANAVTLNSVTVNLARIAGAALGGALVAALGVALCFYCNACSFLLVVVALLLMRADQVRPSDVDLRRRGQLREGFRYVASCPELLLPLLAVTVVGALAWEFPVSLPLLAQRAFGGGAATYGTMTAVMGVGAVVGGLLSASRSRAGRGALGLAALGWGTAISLAAVAPSLPLEYLALVFVGYGSISFNAMAKTTLQLAAEPRMRGRVMALWALAWQGTTPLGGPLIGWIGETFGARWSLLAGGLPTVAVGALALPTLVAGRRAETRSHRPPTSDA
jgi:MFS family permease